MSDFQSPFELTEVVGEDAAQLTVRVAPGWVINAGGAPVRDVALTAHRAGEWPPMVGQTVMVHGRAVTVADVRIDSGGRIEVRDEDTGAWCVYGRAARR